MMECIKNTLKNKPLNRKNLLHYYFPMAGSISYAGLGVGVIQPGLLRRLSPSGNDLTNTFLATSIAGSFLYIYNAKHLVPATIGEKVTFSLFNSTMFNLGSLLLWAMVRSGTQDVDAPQFKFFIAVTSAYWLIKVGIKYLDLVDKQIK